MLSDTAMENASDFIFKAITYSSSNCHVPMHMACTNRNSAQVLLQKSYTERRLQL